MSRTRTKLSDRAERKTVRRDAKKLQIAGSAIAALKELGYANTSLRDISDRCELSLGMLLYYFEDRSDLIIYCVDIYKQDFVRKLVDALDEAEGQDGVLDALANALVTSIVDDDMAHRLWYDIRAQAMFDQTFRPKVEEIESALIGIVEKAIEKVSYTDPVQVEMKYAQIDGVFRYIFQHEIGRLQHERDKIYSGLRTNLAQIFGLPSAPDGAS